MLAGSYITRLSGLDQFGPPFPRGGQSALFSIETLDVPGGGVRLAIEIEHKNEGDTAWSTVANFAAISSTGIETVVATAVKEMLRFKYTVTAGLSPQVYDTFYYRMLAPAWAP